VQRKSKEAHNSSSTKKALSTICSLYESRNEN
jgi:hypothetical protein